MGGAFRSALGKHRSTCEGLPQNHQTKRRPTVRPLTRTRKICSAFTSALSIRPPQRPPHTAAYATTRPVHLCPLERGPSLNRANTRMPSQHSSRKPPTAPVLSLFLS